MTMFLLGYAAAIATYLAVGAGIGVHLVCTNLARYFAAGFRWKVMARTVGTAMLLWPMWFSDDAAPE
jgi:hypothetical protein